MPRWRRARAALSGCRRRHRRRLRRRPPDEFVPPAVIDDYAGMRDGDGILCFNFRADRVREILAALLDPGFDGFARRAHRALLPPSA